MAADPQLLLRVGADLTTVKNAIKDLFSQINTLGDTTAANTKKGVDGIQGQLNALYEAAKASLSIARDATAADASKVAGLRSQTAEYRAQLAVLKTQTSEDKAAQDVLRAKIAISQADTAQAQQTLNATKATTAAIQQQVAALKAKTAAQLQPGGGAGGAGGGTGGGGGGIGGLLGGLLGGGIAGGVATGVLAATGIGAAVTAASDGLLKFIEHLKDAVIEGGKLTQVQDVFERLAQGAGVDASNALLKLQQSTDGLVSKLQLMQTANAAMRGPLKLNSDQIADLTGNVVKLSLASGHTASEGMTALQTALARGGQGFVRLARVTGLSADALRTLALPPGIGQIEKGADRAAYAIAEISKQAKAVGEPIETVGMLFQRMSISTKNLEDSFVVGFNRSAGLQVFLSDMQKLSGETLNLQKVVERLGDAFGTAFAVVGPMIQAIIAPFKALWTISVQVYDSFLQFFNITNVAKTEGMMTVLKGIGFAFIGIATMIQLAGNYLRDFILVLGQSRGAVVGLAQAMGGILTGNFAQINTGIMALVNTLPKAYAAAKTQLTQTTKDGLAQGQKMVDDYNASINKAFTTQRKRAPIPKPDFVDQVKPSSKESKDELAEQLAANKLKLDEKKANIAEAQRLDDDAYEHSQETMAVHYAKQADLIRQGYQAQLTFIQANLRAQTAEVASELQHQLITSKDATSKINKDRLDAQRQTVDAVKTLQKELATNSTKQDRDTLAQIVDAQAKSVALAKATAAAQRQQLSGKLTRGEINPDEYNQGQIAAITALAQAQISAAQTVYDAQTKYGKDITATQKQEEANTKAIFDAQTALNKLRDEEATKAQSYVNKLYQPQQKALEDQLQAQKEIGPSSQGKDAQGKTQDQLQQDLLKNLDAQKTALEGAIQLAQPYSEQWYSIYENIERVYEAQVKYNQELQRSHDLAKPIGEAFGVLGTGISSVFHSNFGQNLGAVVSQGSKSLSESNQRRGILFGNQQVQKDPAQLKLEQQATSLFDAAGGSAKTLVSPFGNLAQAVAKATAALNSMGGKGSQTGGPPDVGDASESVDLGSSIYGAIPTAPAYSGTSNIFSRLGASMSKSLKGIFGKGSGSDSDSNSSTQASTGLQQFTQKLGAAVTSVTDFVSSITNAKSAMAGVASGGLSGASTGNTFGGPIGAAIGAGIGAVLGGIVGDKENKVKNNINDLETSQKQIMQAYSENTNNLQQTVVQLQGLIQQAQQEQASSKKGGDKYQDVINQYSTQLVQLQTQQAQILHQFNEQLAVLSAPTGMQQYLTTLQQIVDQYNQFAGAAQNANDLANANQFLTLSLQQYTTQMAQQFGQEETSAINDALQLNDLLQQRVQYMAQVNDQIRGVLTAGVLTRTATFAQTKGQQVEQIQFQYQQQLDQMNLQISVDQNKVNAETQVFNLATTRIGLETELIQLQNAQTAYSMNQISAMKDLLTAFASGNFGGAIGNLLSSIPSTTTPVGTASALQQLMTQAYQGFASLGLYNLNGPTG